MSAVLQSKTSTDYHGRRPRSGRLGPQGNRHRRDRDARSDGDPRRIRASAAAARRAHRRLAAHDDPDRGADRDAAGARRRSALGFVQHLSTQDHAAAAIAARRHAGVRLQGRVARRILGLHPSHLRMAERRVLANMILDDGGDATLLVHIWARVRRKIRRPAASEPTKKRRVLFAAIKATARQRTQLVLEALRQHQWRDRRDHHRREAPVPDGTRKAAAVSRRSTSTIRSPNRSSTICTAAANRWSTASSARPTS